MSKWRGEAAGATRGRGETTATTMPGDSRNARVSRLDESKRRSVKGSSGWQGRDCLPSSPAKRRGGWESPRRSTLPRALARGRDEKPARFADLVDWDAVDDMGRGVAHVGLRGLFRHPRWRARRMRSRRGRESRWVGRGRWKRREWPSDARRSTSRDPRRADDAALPGSPPVKSCLSLGQSFAYTSDGERTGSLSVDWRWRGWRYERPSARARPSHLIPQDGLMASTGAAEFLAGEEGAKHIQASSIAHPRLPGWTDARTSLLLDDAVFPARHSTCRNPLKTSSRDLSAEAL